MGIDDLALEETSRSLSAAVLLLVSFNGCTKGVPHQDPVAQVAVAPDVGPVVRSRRAPHRDPVPYVTRGPDSGPVVLRSALESSGIEVRDYEALRAECGVDPKTGASVDDLEAVAKKHGLPTASQLLEVASEVVESGTELPAIAIADTPTTDDPHLLDFWLLWRREGDRVLVMNPRAGNVWMTVEDVERALHVHEMEIPVSTQALASRAMVRRDGDRVRVRGAVIVKLAP
jgi:hypothetical protein